jgi:hypothetical protein
MPPPRVRNFAGLHFGTDAVYGIVENISYEATESSLHDIMDHLDEIRGPKSEEVVERIRLAYEAMVRLEEIMLDITSFYRAPERNAPIAQPEAYDPNVDNPGPVIIRVDGLGIGGYERAAVAENELDDLRRLAGINEVRSIEPRLENYVLNDYQVVTDLHTVGITRPLSGNASDNPPIPNRVDEVAANLGLHQRD